MTDGLTDGSRGGLDDTYATMHVPRRPLAGRVCPRLGRRAGWDERADEGRPRGRSLTGRSCGMQVGADESKENQWFEKP